MAIRLLPENWVDESTDFVSFENQIYFFNPSFPPLVYADGILEEIVIRGEVKK